jgi:hypothetical protein
LAADIRLSSEQEKSPSTEGAQPEAGFLDWLFGTDTTQNDRAWYSSNLRDRRTALSVHIHGEGDQGVADLLEQFDPIEMEGRDPSDMDGLAESSQTGVEEDEQAIPVTREQLEMGKRQTERRYRVRMYAIQHPVEQESSFVMSGSSLSGVLHRVARMSPTEVFRGGNSTSLSVTKNRWSRKRSGRSKK